MNGFERDIEYIMRYYSFIYTQAWRDDDPLLPFSGSSLLSLVEGYVQETYWFRIKE